MLKVAQQNTIPFNNLTKNINYQLLIETHSRKSKNAEKRSRYRRSDAEPDDHKLPFPRNFLKGEAVADGDCFFDSLAQGMNQLNLGELFNVKSLRQACFDYARDNAEAFYDSRTGQTWQQAITAAASLGGYAANSEGEAENFNSYLPRIVLTAKNKNELEILGLTQPIWGRPEIEGRLLCQKYGIKLHLIEKHTINSQEVITHQLVDSSESRSTDAQVSLYNDPKVVHVLNEGHAHFVPILPKLSVFNRPIEKQERLSSVEGVELQDKPIDRLALYPAQPSATHPQQELAIPLASKSNKKVTRQLPTGTQSEKDPQSAQQSGNRQGDNEANQPGPSSRTEQVSIQENLKKTTLSVQEKVRDRKISINNRELLVAAGEGDVESIQSLIRNGVDVDFKDRDGNTALHYAVEGDKLEIVEMLIKNGADIGLCNNGKKNPLDLSILLNKKNIIPILSLSKHLKTVQEQDKTAREIFNIEEHEDLLPISDSHYLILNGAIGEKLPSDGQKQDTSQKNTEVEFSKSVNRLVRSIILKFDKISETELDPNKNFLFYLIRPKEEKILKILVAISGFHKAGQEGYLKEHEECQGKLEEAINDAQNKDNFFNDYSIKGIFVPFSKQEERSITTDVNLFDPLLDAFKNFEQFEQFDQDSFTNKMSLIAKILQGGIKISHHAVNTMLKKIELPEKLIFLIRNLNEACQIFNYIKKTYKKDLKKIYNNTESITITLLKKIEEEQNSQKKQGSDKNESKRKNVNPKFCDIEKNIDFLKKQSHRLHLKYQKEIISFINSEKVKIDINKYKESLKNVWKHFHDIDVFNMIKYQARCSEDNLIDYLSYNSDILKEKGKHYIFSIEKGKGISKKNEFKTPVRYPCSYCILHFPLEFSIIASSKAGLPIFNFKDRLEIPKSVDNLSIKEKLLYLSKNAPESYLKNIFNKDGYPFPLNEFNQNYLTNAVKRNMKEVLEKSLEIKTYEPDLSKALCDAALVGSTDVIDYLIEKKVVPIDYKIVATAVSKNHKKEIIKLLVNLDTNKENIEFLNLVNIAAYYKREDIFEEIAKKIPSKERFKAVSTTIKDVSDKNKPMFLEPLYIAIDGSNVETIKYIWDLQKKEGIQPNNKIISDDITPLNSAAVRGDYEIFEFLINEGFFIKEHLGKHSPAYSLELAVNRGNKEIAGALLNKMIENHMMENIKKLITSSDSEGFVMLHYLSIYGFHEIIEKLLSETNLSRGEKEKITNHKDVNDMRPLHYAVLFNNKEKISQEESLFNHQKIVDILVKNGADIEAQMIGGATSLHLATQFDHRELVGELLKKGANVNAVKNDRGMPLHLAAGLGYHELVKELLKQGANVNAERNDKVTPLYLAAQEGHLDIVNTLLKNGAQVNTEASGWTPIKLAAYEKHWAIAVTLLNYSAEITDLSDAQCDLLKQYVEHSDYVNKPQLLQLIEKHLLTSTIERLRKLRAKSESVGLETVAGADCLPRRRSQRALGRCAEGEEREGRVFPYEPLEEHVPVVERQAARLYGQLALADAWQQGASPNNLLRYQRYLGEILEEGEINQSPREQQLVREHYQQAQDFFQNHPKPTLLEAQADDFEPLAGYSVLLKNGQQSLLVFNEGPRYQLYSPDFNYRQRFQSRPGVSWGELSAFVQAFFQWKTGSRDYHALVLKDLPEGTLKALRQAPFWKPEALAPDSVLLAREALKGIEGIPPQVVRELIRVNGQVVEASALHADFFQHTTGIQLRVENLHTVLGELTAAQRRSLVRVVRKYQWAADSTLLESLDAETQPLFADYQQRVMTELKTAKTLTPERLAEFSWQAMQQAFNRAEIPAELTQQALMHLQELQASAAKRAWAQGMATQALFFLPDMIRAANSGKVEDLAKTAGMLAADSTWHHLSGKLLEHFAPTLSEARLGILRKLPIISPVFKFFLVSSIIDLTQQLQSLPPDSEQRNTIKHRLGEQYVTVGLVVAELFGWELGPLWVALIAEQLIFEAITFRKENQLDIPFWEAFIMSLGFEQAKLQNIFEERQLVEINLGNVNNLNTQAQPPYGLVLVRVPSLGPRTWNDIDESQVPPEIREQVLNRPEPFFSFISNTVIREASGFQQISEHVSNVQGVDASGKSIRGRLVKSYWKRGDYTAQAAAITVHWIPSGSSRQEDNIFLKQLTIPQGVNSTFERLVSVVGSDYQAEVTQSPIRITGNGLGALYAVKQPSPTAASTKNLFLGFDPREGDTSLKIHSSGWKHLESVYPGSSTKAKTSLTVQVGPKGYPPAILFPPKLGILMVEDKSRHLHSHYFISSDSTPFYLYDDTLTTHIAITPPRNRPIGFTVRSYDIAMLQLQTWAPNSSRTVPDLPAAFYLDIHPGNLKQALQPLLPQQISMLHLPNNRQYLQLMLKQQQIAGMLTLSAKRVDVLFAKGQDAYQSGIVMTTTVARFTVTVQGHLQIKQGNTHLFFIGETPNAEVISYSKQLSTGHLPLYQLELPDLRPVLNSLSRLYPQETQFSTPGLNYKWFPGVERPATLRITGLLGSVLLHDKWAQLLLEHNETTLSQLDEQNPRVLAVKHYTPQATLDNQLVLQQLIPAGGNAAKPVEYQQESDDLQHLRVIDILFPDKNSDSLWFQSSQRYPIVHRFPTQQTLTLNGIDYQVIGKQLYAIGAPNGVIDGEQLLRYRTSTRRVGIRLNQSLAESTLSLDQDSLTINQLTLRHLPSQTPIVLGEQAFPLRALKESVHRQRYRRALPSAKPPAFERSQNQPESLSLKPLASGASQNKPWSSQLIKQVVTLLGGVHWEWPALFSSWGSSSNQKPTILDSGQPTPQGLQTVGEYTVGHLQGGIQLVDLLMRKMTRKRYQHSGTCATTPLTEAEARLASLQQQYASFASHDNLVANPYRGHRVDTLSTPQWTATPINRD